MATITLTVTVSNPGSGNKYYIDSVLQDTVSMTAGNTYKFDQADSSNGGHPLRISTTSDGTHNSGSEYTTGVTTYGTPGSAGAYTQLEVTASTAQTLYYYCTNHSGMGGAINVASGSQKLKELSGFTVRSLASDPVPLAQDQINNPYGGVWSSGGNLNQAKKQMGGAGLSPTASIVFGGVQGSPPSLGTTESYNGSTWTELNDMPQVTQYVAGVGTSTAAVAIAGIGGPSDPPKGDYVQEWNGSSWSTNPNAYPFTGYSLAGAGTATASIISGGDPARTDVNTFDGTSFTSSTAMNTGRRGHGSVGTTTANLVVGGETPRTANTEIWNGSSWTEVNNYPAATQDLSAWGTSTSAIGALGYDTANSVNSASWDGTSWTETADLATARNGANRGGLGTNNTEGLVAGGEAPPVTASTEEWGFTGTPPAAPITDYTDAIVGQIYYNSTSGVFKATTLGGAPIGTWSSGGSLNTARYSLGAAGTSNSYSLAFGGASPSRVAVTESYDGSSWTEVNDLNSARNELAGFGTQTSALSAGGYEPPGVSAKTESWDGTNWTEVNDMNSGRNDAAGFGLQTAGISATGAPATPTNVESWNGSSWTEIAEVNTGRAVASGFGIQTSGIIAGGDTPPVSALTEQWNGSSWTEVSDLNTARKTGNSNGSGTSTAGLVYGGEVPANTGKTEFWNGSSWTEVNDLSTARNRIAGDGTSNSTLAFGGYTTGAVATTEEFEAADFENKTLTTS